MRRLTTPASIINGVAARVPWLVLSGDSVVCRVATFTDFVRAYYKTMAEISRGEMGWLCEVKIYVEVGGLLFFLKVEDGGVRYGRC